MKASYDFSRGRRGAVVPIPGSKTRITIRIDEAILDWFRRAAHASGGGNYQTLINEALRVHIARANEPLEDILRRVIREEMPARKPARKPRPAAKGVARPGKTAARGVRTAGGR